MSGPVLFLLVWAVLIPLWALGYALVRDVRRWLRDREEAALFVPIEWTAEWRERRL